MTQTILILDFGSQVTQLIARRVREAGVYCQVLPYNCDAKRALASNPSGVILSGGPASVLDEGSPYLPEFVMELGVPIFGICYGQQLLMQALGGASFQITKPRIWPRKLRDHCGPCPVVGSLGGGRRAPGLDVPR